MPVSPRGKILYMSGAPVFISGAMVYVAAAQEIPLNCLALVARGSLCSWVTRDCHNWRDSSWKATIPGVLHTQQTETNPQSFLERGLFVCPGVLALCVEGRAVFR